MNKVLSRKYARRLVREGKAVVTGFCYDGRAFITLDRLDLQRTDHVAANQLEIRMKDAELVESWGDQK